MFHICIYKLRNKLKLLCFVNAQRICCKEQFDTAKVAVRKYICMLSTNWPSVHVCILHNCIEYISGLSKLKRTVLVQVTVPTTFAWARTIFCVCVLQLGL